MTRRSFLALAATAPLGAVPRCAMGIATPTFTTARHPNDTLEFLEYCHSLGAGGIQAGLSSLDAPYIATLRRRAEELGMYVEAMAGLPGESLDAFERTVAAAKQAGVLCLRTVAPGPRRYESFATLNDWKRAAADSEAALRRVLPIAERHRLPLAVENHRDRTLDEWLELLGRFSSEYLGFCLDIGNNLALLDDPIEVAERLAPYVVSTHIKDMGVEEFTEGFYLAETPLGEGILDVKRMVATIAKARPKAKMTLEMITRDPTPIPCLTQKYWITMPARDARYLARTLSTVRAVKRPLPRLTGLDAAARLRLEEDNVKRCLTYAREKLGL